MNANDYEVRVMTEAMRILAEGPDEVTKLALFQEVTGFRDSAALIFTEATTAFILERLEDVGPSAIVDALMLGLFTAQACANVRQQDALNVEVPDGP